MTIVERPVAPEPGQVWKPSRGRASPKIVASISKHGIVCTLRHPPDPRNGVKTYMPLQKWDAWVVSTSAVLDREYIATTQIAMPRRVRMRRIIAEEPVEEAARAIKILRGAFDLLHIASDDDLATSLYCMIAVLRCAVEQRLGCPGLMRKTERRRVHDC